MLFACCFNPSAKRRTYRKRDRIIEPGKGFAIIKIENRLKELGYNVKYKVLQAAHYGVPQSRWRLFVVGYKNQKFSFPEPTHAAEITPNFIRGRELPSQRYLPTFSIITKARLQCGTQYLIYLKSEMVRSSKTKFINFRVKTTSNQPEEMVLQSC